MTPPDDEIARRLTALLARTTVRPPATRRVLEHLPQIEEAIARGVARADLAAACGLEVSQFTAALAGARRLQRQGGDGRRTEVRQRRKAAATTLPQGPTPLGGPLVQRFGGDAK